MIDLIHGTDHRMIDQESFERAVEASIKGVSDPRAGLFGPDSTMWRVARESVVFLGGGAAALLQLAHPYVAYAVDQHSETRKDPVGRFNRTFQNVHGMVFGDLRSAVASSTNVRRIHDGIVGEMDEGTPSFDAGHIYRAHSMEAVFWVQATLVHTALAVYDQTVRPLSYAEKDAYYQESKRFVGLFGVEAKHLPEDFDAFLVYFHAQLERLYVTKPAKDMARFLLTPPNRLSTPLAQWYGVMTAGLLPESLREEFGLPFARLEEGAYERSLSLLRHTYTKLPSPVRFLPAYLEALNRLDGKHRAARVGRFLERAVLRGIRPQGSSDTSQCPVSH